MTKTTTGAAVAKSDWYVWAYGKALADMTDTELSIYATRAWNVSDMQQIPDFRAEQTRRGMKPV